MIDVRISDGKGSASTVKVGEHNQQIYQDLLGYSDETVTELQEQGVI